MSDGQEDSVVKITTSDRALHNMTDTLVSKKKKQNKTAIFQNLKSLEERSNRMKERKYYPTCTQYTTKQIVVDFTVHGIVE